VLGLAAQVVLFSEPATMRVGELGPPLYVGTTLMVLAAIVRNRAIAGMPLVIAGAISNLAAIVANGGYMPAGAAAMAALGREAPTVYSNSAVVAAPALWPLTDIFAMPPWLPFANIFSIGDVLIMAGVAMTIVIAMRRPTEDAASPGAFAH
jgi:lipoprotein signal peptidase